MTAAAQGWDRLGRPRRHAPEAVELALTLRAEGHFYTEIAERLGVPKATVAMWCKGVDTTQADARRPTRIVNESWRATVNQEMLPDCIKWTAALTDDGYGWVRQNGRARLAHRVSYEAKYGAVPDGLSLDHLCRNRSCVNPDHLEPVTPAENARRGVNATKTHCKHGHPFDADNTHVRSDGHRDCKQCIRDGGARYRARKRAERNAR